MWRFLPLLLASLWVLALGACTHHLHIPYRPTAQASVRLAAARDMAVFYAYDRARLNPRMALAESGETASYRVFSFRFQSAGENGQEGNRVTGRYFQQKTPGRKRLVIVLPIYGSSTLPARAMTKAFLGPVGDGETNVVMLDGEEELLDWEAMAAAETEDEFWREIDRGVQAFRSTVIDIRRLVDWAQQQPEIDQQRIGIVGFSIGALLVGVALGVEPRISTGALIMGGGNLHEIMATCGGDHDKRDVGSVRGNVLRRFGWSAETYARKLQPRLEVINPIPYAHNVHPQNVIIVDSALDRCVPVSARLELWEALGRPERFSLFYGHKMSFLSMTPLGFNQTSKRVCRFLEARLLGQRGCRAGGHWPLHPGCTERGGSSRGENDG